MEKKKLPKGCSIAVGVIVVIFAIYIAVKLVSWVKSPVESTNIDFSQQWSSMTYEERSDFLIKAIESKSFVNATEAEHAVREAIKKELRNPKTVSFIWSPTIYNNAPNVVEADSGWMYVPFKCNAKNDFGVEKEIMGSVTYKYVPETNSLAIHRWDVNQNN
ncbi:hypothetical protein [Dysgonomonas reticulitermitis]